MKRWRYPLGCFTAQPLKAALAGWALVVMLAAQAPAESLKETTSLQFVPADVAFYSCSLRNREQWELFVNSNAFDRLKNLPFVQFGWGMLQLQWQNPQQEQVRVIKEFLDAPENQPLLALLSDALSHETFSYGDQGFAQLVDLANRFNSMNREAQIEQITTQEPSQKILARKLLKAASEQLANYRAPTFVMGFRVTDKERATEQLGRLETLLRNLAQQDPRFEGRILRQVIDDVNYLTVKLDGSLIPWEEVPLDDLGEDREAAEKLIEQVKRTNVVLALGVRGDYLLFSSGETADHLDQLGSGELLADRKELQPLAKLEDQRVVSVSYLSREFAQKANASERQLDDLKTMAQSLAPLAQVDEEVRKEMIADVEKFVDQIKAWLPQPGAVLSYTWLTPRGYEGYSYNWTSNPSVVADKPLTILEHVGGSPLLFAAGRTAPLPGENYQQLVHLLGRFAHHFKRISLDSLEEEDRAKYDKFLEATRPLVERLNTVTRDNLLPALQDGQSALVLDAEASSTQWFDQMPPADQPLPMLQFAVVWGVSDGALLKKALREYFEIAQAFIHEMHQVDPEQVPDFQLPPPETEQVGETTLYSYQLPAEAGLDEQLVPNGAVAPQLAVASLFKEQTKRLLEKTSLEETGTPLSDTSRSLAGAVHVDVAGLVDAVTPWINYGFNQAAKANAEQGGANPLMLGVQVQVQTVLEVIKCFRSVTAATYAEGDALITHFETRVEDLP